MIHAAHTMPPSSSLNALLAPLILTAGKIGALTGETSIPAAPTSPSLRAYFQYVQDTAHTALRLLWDLIRAKYERALHGQLRVSDMVQLLAFCSLIQGLRVWRGQHRSQGAEIHGVENEELKAGGAERGSRMKEYLNFSRSSKFGMFKRI